MPQTTQTPLAHGELSRSRHFTPDFYAPLAFCVIEFRSHHQLASARHMVGRQIQSGHFVWVRRTRAPAYRILSPLPRRVCGFVMDLRGPTSSGVLIRVMFIWLRCWVIDFHILLRPSVLDLKLLFYFPKHKINHLSLIFTHQKHRAVLHSPRHPLPRNQHGRNCLIFCCGRVWVGAIDQTLRWNQSSVTFALQIPPSIFGFCRCSFCSRAQFLATFVAITQHTRRNRPQSKAPKPHKMPWSVILAQFWRPDIGLASPHPAAKPILQIAFK